MQCWYVDDSLIKLPPRLCFLNKLMHICNEYGDVRNLRASAAKSEILAMEEEVDQLMDASVAKMIKFLGVCMGLLEPNKGFENM